jgi:hypothetical protein
MARAGGDHGMTNRIARWVVVAAWVLAANASWAVLGPRGSTVARSWSSSTSAVCSVDLMVGGTTRVGSVSIDYPTASNLLVRYHVDDGYSELRVTRLFVVIARAGSPPQAHTFVHEWLKHRRDEFVIPWSALGLQAPTCLVFVAQADVDTPGGFQPPDLDAFAAGLPDLQWMVVHEREDEDSYLEAEFLSGCLVKGLQDLWCADTDHEIAAGNAYHVESLSSYEPVPTNVVDLADNLDLANYLMNQHVIGQPSSAWGAYTFGDVQRALWQLLEGLAEGEGTDPWDQNRVDELAALAQANGEGFTPGCGDGVAVLLNPVDDAGNTVAQVTFIEVPLSCAPILRRATAWGIGSLGWNGQVPYFLCCPP